MAQRYSSAAVAMGHNALTRAIRRAEARNLVARRQIRVTQHAEQPALLPISAPAASQVAGMAPLSIIISGPVRAVIPYRRAVHPQIRS